MNSTACTAQRHAQHYVHNITSRTALHAQHYMPSTHAQRTQHCMHSTTHTANPGRRSSSGWRGANPRRVLHGFAGRRKLPGRHIRCASGAPQRATLARTALMRRSLRWLCRLLIAAVLADVALCGAPDAHLVCLPGSNLLPAGSHSPPSWGCNPEEEPSMPSTCSVLHVRHSDSSAYTAFCIALCHAQH